MRIKILIGYLLIGFLVSCDPAQTIEIENTSTTESTIKFYFKGKDYDKFESFVSEDSLVLKLDSNEKRNYDFGIGTWEINNCLDTLVSRVEKIEIITKKSTEIFCGKSQVESFFESRIIDDRYKARIIIKL